MGAADERPDKKGKRCGKGWAKEGSEGDFRAFFIFRWWRFFVEMGLKRPYNCPCHQPGLKPKEALDGRL
jgi:hypothetical protein